MNSSVKSTNKYDKAQIDKGFKKVHIWVPSEKVDEIKHHAQLLRDTHKKEAVATTKIELGEKLANLIDLRLAYLRLAKFKGADLRNADLRWANLKGVDLRDVKLAGAKLEGAKLKEAEIMTIKIEHVAAHKTTHTVLHKEQNTANLTLKQFVKFDYFHHNETNRHIGIANRDDLIPTFIFDNSTVCANELWNLGASNKGDLHAVCPISDEEVYVDEFWNIGDNCQIATSSDIAGIVRFSSKHGQYMQHYHGGKVRGIGQLISITIKVTNDILETLKQIGDIEIIEKELSWIDQS